MDKAVSYLYLSHPLAFALMIIITFLSLTTGVGAQNPEWIVYNTENSELPENQIWTLAFDPQDALWVGTHQGVARFDGTTWTVYTTENSGLPSNDIWALAADAQGNLWIGTRGGGLAVYREGGVAFP